MYEYGNYYTDNTRIPSFSAQSRAYWERSFFQRMRGLWKLDGLPDAAPHQVQTDRDAFLWGLFKSGYITVFESKTYGITFQPSTPHGIGLQFQPWGMTINSPFFNFTRPLVIGTECENIKLTPDFTGVWDIIEKYAQEMQYMDIAIRQSMLNARIAYIAGAKDVKEARSLKAFFANIENGDPYLVYNSNLRNTIKGEAPELPWAQFDRDLRKNFILPDLQECRRNVIDSFYREVGIPVSSGKKERETATESETNTAEFFNRRAVWDECLAESCDRVNRLFKTNIRFTPVRPESIERGGQADAIQNSIS